MGAGDVVTAALILAAAFWLLYRSLWRGKGSCHGCSGGACHGSTGPGLVSLSSRRGGGQGPSGSGAGGDGRAAR